MSEIEQIFASLRWDADMVVTSPFGERVWLKECFNEEGRRIGITECCLEDNPCEWHRSLEAHKEKVRPYGTISPREEE